MTTELEELRHKVERLQEAVALLLAYDGHVQIPDHSALRRAVRRNAVGLATDAVESARRRQVDQTQRVQFSGRNTQAVSDFVGRDGTLRAGDGGLWLVSDGRSWLLVPGTWISRDPDTGVLGVGERFDPADVYREVQYENT